MLTVLDFNDSRKIFRNTVLREDYKNIRLVTLSEKKRCLKHILKEASQDKIIIREKDINRNIVKGKVAEYRFVPKELINSILKKTCREIALKFNMQCPLNEVVIIGKLSDIEPLFRILADETRLFTVVSDEYDKAVFDKLYFESGCIIRRKDIFDCLENSEKLIIYAGGDYKIANINSPILNITTDEIEGKTVINITNIKIFDDNISDAVSALNCRSGVVLYSLLDIFPSENFSVNPDVKANRIFLLDRSKF